MIDERRRHPRLVFLAMLLSLLALGAAACGDDEDTAVDDMPADEEVVGDETTTTEAADTNEQEDGATALRAELAALNGSEASGQATVELRGSQVVVTVRTEGVSAMLPHAQHIHIGGKNECPPPDAGSKSAPNDLVDTAEGQPSYGEVKVSLTTEGDVGAESALAVPRFPTADDSGSYTYTRTFDLPSGTTEADVRNGVIVVHGISKLFGDKAKYDGEAKSSLDPSLPLEATIPALCGKLESQS